MTGACASTETENQTHSQKLLRRMLTRLPRNTKGLFAEKYKERTNDALYSLNLIIGVWTINTSYSQTVIDLTNKAY